MFSNTKIQFYLCKVSQEYDDQLTVLDAIKVPEFDKFELESLRLRYPVLDGVGVYVVNRITYAGAIGLGVIPSPTLMSGNGNAIVISGSGIWNPLLFAHELGHYVGLGHTFWDPNFQDAPNSDCTNGASCTGPCLSPIDGQTYTNVPYNNIMSYHSSFCTPKTFTEAQARKARNVLESNINRSWLKNVTPTCQSIVNKGFIRLPKMEKEAFSQDHNDYSPVTGIPISLNGCSTNSDVTGKYTVDGCGYNPSSSFNISLTGTNNNVPVLATGNGVSVLDVVKIRKHILGTELFKSQYQYIAADVSGNGAVSILDVAQVEKVILGTSTSFNVGSWRYIPHFTHHSTPFRSLFSLANVFNANWTNLQGAVKSYALPGASNTYFNQLTLPASSELALNPFPFIFNAIKSGNVEDIGIPEIGAASGNIAVSQIDAFANLQQKRNYFFTENKGSDCIQQGDKVKVTVSLESDDDILGFQMGIWLDTTKVQVNQVKYGDIHSLNKDKCNDSQKGAFKIVWSDDRLIPISKGKLKRVVVFDIVAKNDICSLADVIRLDDRVLETTFVGAASEEPDVVLVLDANSDNAQFAPRPAVGAVYPNPAKNELSFEIVLDKRAVIELELRDNWGNTVRKTVQMEEGSNVLTINDLSKLQKGALSYSIIIDNKHFSGKLIKI